MYQTNVITCAKCGGKFTWHEANGGYPGGKDRESIDCPYCGTEADTIVISGIVVTEKVESPSAD